MPLDKYKICDIISYIYRIYREYIENSIIYSIVTIYTIFPLIFVLEERKMGLDEIDWDDPDLAAEPLLEVDWSIIERQVDASIDSLGVHNTWDHFWTAVSAYEDQIGGCTDSVCRDTLSPLVAKLIERRF